MRTSIVIGTALTAAILTMTADVIGGVIGANQLSVNTGIVIRSFLVVGALAVTAAAWWLRMRTDDRPETLLAGLMGGWLLNVASWGGGAFIGQLMTNLAVGAFLIDLILWGAVAFSLVFLLSRTSTTTVR